MLSRFLHLLGVTFSLSAAFGLLARFVPPDVWWPPAVVPLFLPILLALTLLYASWNAYRRRWKWTALPALVLLLSLPMAKRLFAISTGGSAAGASSISVITANLRGFQNDLWKDISFTAAEPFLGGAKPDVLLLQETRTEGHRANFVAEIKASTGLAKRHQPPGKAIATYANDPTFVADKFIETGAFNGYLITDVTTELGKIRVINAHLQSNRISAMAGQIGEDDTLGEGLNRAESMLRNYRRSAILRAQQANEIRRAIHDSPYPVIVGGDFNDVPSSYTYQRIRSPRLRDAWADRGFGPGTTFTGPLPGLRIDFLLVDTSLSVRSIERIETGFSDHRALRAVISR
ncbi:endonuclease/exonuclease/phosphatase family protein [Neolewinella lacunae]|uniref:Endonuclease/exonuclease/phosphatase family protein n=1 Tax=Neolewinella lacunae TaxID=1517758 RepID=A0A923T8B7_9BACT|nr:endonuclease/exonuclease/phosphatase family protein [Neolewinella lacunae]MBC6994406.1 endonuclease/exonuclease/phosphatase family protein [Neolewinella lacunae]MDN3633337.1 endonuclease/exonuclease/phosphatase family protein [Neolewinella lacunae]